ncbi:Uncharacterized protein TPAR_03706 [Tolypocladium paradoxum]|uniref:Uncharacterized protein n=1 Tax=Tolypocladium paradoxum TaxID=94208 RepID=A0A2S4L119_9HYPO|nr:Uncharacterized protein TPAR_03706 [Tolypocladium paradoxum]
MDLRPPAACEAIPSQKAQSYPSSDTGPTLEALKQHAQSLLFLIRKTTDMETVGSVTGDREDGRLLFNSKEAFDLLANLNRPYRNGDKSHRIPLWGILNDIEQEHEAGHQCPLKPANALGPIAAGNRPVRPYRDHQSLVMHANECLEILDHEYASAGGLLSILPSESEEDAEHLEMARGTLIGQWLLSHSHLFARTGEMELNHALVLDLVEREAVLPAQMLSRSSPDGKSKVADPQDRFVLADAGHDLFEMIHRIMDKEEVAIEKKERL